MQQPTLDTARLRLRPYGAGDAPAVQRLAGDARIADTTSSIPHPYPDGAAAEWISGHQASFEARESAVFAVTLRADDQLVGTISLFDVSIDDARAEMGYWIGVPYWGQGYASEAAGALIGFAHDAWNLTRIVARCFARNPASARVMQKIGMTYEGMFPLHGRKNGRFEDQLLYGLNLAGRGDR